MINLCSELIQYQSYSGEENSVAERIKQAFQELGFDSFWIDDYGNIVGQIKGKRSGKSILFDGHIDTVPVPDDSKWKHALSVENWKMVRSMVEEHLI